MKTDPEEEAREGFNNTGGRKKRPEDEASSSAKGNSISSEEETVTSPDRLWMGEILPGLWIGNLQSLRKLNDLQHLAWTVISVLKSEKLLLFARTALQETAETVERHLEWELSDDVQADFLSPRLEQVLRAMDAVLLDDRSPHTTNIIDPATQNKRACLVHCAFGVSRSATVCAAWLLTRKGLSLQQALHVIRQARPHASPNMGFIAGLRALEQCQGDIVAARGRLKLPVAIREKDNANDRWE